MRSNTKGSLILVLCAFVWGMAFSAQSSAMEHIGPMTFVFLRAIITSIVLFAAYPLFGIRKKAKNAVSAKKVNAKSYLILGGVLGIILVAAVSLQQIGIVYTTAAKSGFITALYIVMIPVIGLFMKKRVSWLVWVAVAVSVIGLMLLCLDRDLSINIGDLLTLVCAFVFSFHIILVDKFAGDMNSVLLSAIQFCVSAIVALPIMLITEEVSISSILACWPSIIYAAVFSGAIGYTLQFIGQKYTEPTLASLLMCLESVFAALGGWVLLGETLLPKEFIGCMLMLGASVVAQIPIGKRHIADKVSGPYV